MKFERGNLLGLEELTAKEIETILETAESFVEISERPLKKVPVLRGLTVVNLFFEPSTRTRISFEIAEKRLSADTVNFAAKTSSAVKGETLKDTARNIESMGIDMLVMRHSAPGAAAYLAGILDCPVINAGDGPHEHPTQALLDLFTVKQNRGGIAGLNVVIVGDILHSRVARSNILCLQALGARVRLCAPPALMPAGVEAMGVEAFHSFDAALEGADVVMMLRLQNERMDGQFSPSPREYRHLYGLTRQRLGLARSHAIVMHPGPMNRGVEIDSDVADDESRSIITQQVEMGVAIRMACLEVLTRKGRGVPGGGEGPWV